MVRRRAIGGLSFGRSFFHGVTFRTVFVPPLHLAFARSNS